MVYGSDGAVCRPSCRPGPPPSHLLTWSARPIERRVAFGCSSSPVGRIHRPGVGLFGQTGRSAASSGIPPPFEDIARMSVLPILQPIMFEYQPPLLWPWTNTLFLS